MFELWMNQVDSMSLPQALVLFALSVTLAVQTFRYFKMEDTDNA